MIAISGGGTGGHLAIARAFCKQLNELGQECIFIGSTNGQDKMWFENDKNFKKCYFLQSSGVVNKRGLAKIFSLFNILKLAIKCQKIFKENEVNAVISVGGYSAAPASIAAILSQKMLFIHEQNAISGKLNSALRRFAKAFYSSYENPPFAYPVDEKFFACKRERKELKTVLFLGGSQGAKAINALALKLAPIFAEKDIKIIHQCGKNQLEELKKAYENFTNLNFELFDFHKQIQEKIQEADLCISRAGASSLWEITANALPAIFIPFPYAAANHQYHNAKFLLDMSLAQICLQNGDDIDENKILSLLENYDINAVSKGLSKLISQEKSK
ncbi:MAG: undecaprenyldiphospho-muramoylpentapeptide beta-N-acetylglucosaminyltransferase, partial [Campylobacter sp.]|nr:undecaprenyldiphospho-muramoylpentapeptide beta-N-acetylglucosaminyltransferase [Campylobacter sp.]